MYGLNQTSQSMVPWALSSDLWGQEFFPNNNKLYLALSLSFSECTVELYSGYLMTDMETD